MDSGRFPTSDTYASVLKYFLHPQDDDGLRKKLKKNMDDSEASRRLAAYRTSVGGTLICKIACIKKSKYWITTALNHISESCTWSIPALADKTLDPLPTLHRVSFPKNRLPVIHNTAVYKRILGDHGARTRSSRAHSLSLQLILSWSSAVTH